MGGYAGGVPVYPTGVKGGSYWCMWGWGVIGWIRGAVVLLVANGIIRRAKQLPEV